MRKEAQELIKELEETFGNSTIDKAIDFIEEIVDKYYDLKEELQQTNEEFAQYRKYGRCYDERD